MIFLSKYLLVLLLLLLREIIVATADRKLSTGDFMVCGGVATAVADALLYPVDTIKVIQQSSKIPVSPRAAAAHILRTAGVAGLFNGVVSYACLDGFGAAIFFAAYEHAKTALHRRSPHPLNVYASASVAYLLSSSFMVPAEKIKATMQSQQSRFLRECIASISKDMGPRGFYHGYGATVLRDLPYFALQLGCYDHIRSILNNLIIQQFNSTQVVPQSRYSPSQLRSFPNRLRRTLRATAANHLDLLASLSSGVITGLLTNPMDVVTSRLMTQPPQLKVPRNNNININSQIFNLKAFWYRLRHFSFRRSVGIVVGSSLGPRAPPLIEPSVYYQGVRDCVVRMAREEGPSSFFIGSFARVCWIAPFTVLSLGLNERIRQRLVVSSERK